MKLSHTHTPPHTHLPTHIFIVAVADLLQFKSLKYHITKPEVLKSLKPVPMCCHDLFTCARNPHITWSYCTRIDSIAAAASIDLNSNQPVSIGNKLRILRRHSLQLNGIRSALNSACIFKNKCPLQLCRMSRWHYGTLGLNWYNCNSCLVWIFFCNFP